MAYTNEELSRRKKPSAIKKKKALDAALERLKKRKASLKEGDERADNCSTLATRGTRNTQVKDKRDPKPYRKGGKFKGPSKERINAIAKGVHSTVKKVGASVSKAYGDSSWSGPRAG